ncbi:hypothetical protein [Vagococcus fluvialis]|uniref:hypothetical protein n=1 Tax=Vagococcus fluvialis TaxID=2738 RepID=UPI001D0AC1B4|nr:hypothetical protein [Vagococcus fluvialis]UDM72700.1 hypothetical protein K5L00_15040 [Vagococcus fluvialis]UDM78423.1 hypothetical protein K5K98_14375 [Vagococcus fluvialis]UDM83975.1 hypothetical protein K5K96_15065 [Vagococcus fluvialis]
MPNYIEILLIVISLYMLLVVAFVDAVGAANKLFFKFVPLVLAVVTGVVAVLSILKVI